MNLPRQQVQLDNSSCDLIYYTELSGKADFCLSFFICLIDLIMLTLGRMKMFKTVNIISRIKAIWVNQKKKKYRFMFNSVQFSRSVVSDSLRPHELQHTRPPCPSPLPEFTQTHVHRVGDAIQPSHPLSSPSPPAPNTSQHQSLFQRVNSSHEVAKILPRKNFVVQLLSPTLVQPHRL